jgi:hypothetical protein
MGRILMDTAKVYAFPRIARPAGLNRDAARQRNADGFAMGLLHRRADIARQLQLLAAEVADGRHGELVMLECARVLALRAKVQA